MIFVSSHSECVVVMNVNVIQCSVSVTFLIILNVNILIAMILHCKLQFVIGVWSCHQRIYSYIIQLMIRTTKITLTLKRLNELDKRVNLTQPVNRRVKQIVPGYSLIARVVFRGIGQLIKRIMFRLALFLFKPCVNPPCNSTCQNFYCKRW